MYFLYIRIKSHCSQASKHFFNRLMLALKKSNNNKTQQQKTPRAEKSTGQIPLGQLNNTIISVLCRRNMVPLMCNALSVTADSQLAGLFQNNKSEITIFFSFFKTNLCSTYVCLKATLSIYLTLKCRDFVVPRRCREN